MAGALALRHKIVNRCEIVVARLNLMHGECMSNMHRAIRPRE
jgi:hypothetical protein